jgi:hypothetical protein
MYGWMDGHDDDDDDDEDGNDEVFKIKNTAKVGSCRGNQKRKKRKRGKSRVTRPFPSRENRRK